MKALLLATLLLIPAAAQAPDPVPEGFRPMAELAEAAQGAAEAGQFVILVHAPDLPFDSLAPNTRIIYESLPEPLAPHAQLIWSTDLGDLPEPLGRVIAESRQNRAVQLPELLVLDPALTRVLNSQSPESLQNLSGVQPFDPGQADEDQLERLEQDHARELRRANWEFAVDSLVGQAIAQLPQIPLTSSDGRNIQANLLCLADDQLTFFTFDGEDHRFTIPLERLDPASQQAARQALPPAPSPGRESEN